ncbi:MAG: FKBP-type peptidyl-prolyl cis-trans isomerase [Gemmatimonadaceae bacterium]|nr:FKBP-type peptidyl-prolyl cis-trans isomerase [Gemmatimonadaceae bacterium]
MRPGVRLSLAALVTALLAAACSAAGSTPAPGEDPLLTTTYGIEAEVLPDQLTRHPRGFLYRDILAGSGAGGTAGRWVQVSYVVRLADGREVDRAEPESPLRFRVGDGSMIPALDIAVREMQVGGVRQLVIPPRLAYGARGRGPVPPNAILVMIARLERVE